MTTVTAPAPSRAARRNMPSALPAAAVHYARAVATGHPGALVLRAGATLFGIASFSIAVSQALAGYAGYGNERIATVLFLSVKTVRNNVSSVLNKLGVDHRAAAVALARDAEGELGTTATS